MSINDNVTTKDIELPDGYVLRSISAPWGAAAGIVVPADKAGVSFGGSSCVDPLPPGARGSSGQQPKE